MTAPDDILDLAVPYALHALSDAERGELESRLARSDAADAFFDEVRAIREAMAAVSAGTELDPPASLRERILTAAGDDTVRTLPATAKRRWRSTVLAAAAALIIGLGAVGIGMTLRPAQQPSTAQQIFAAPDVRTVFGDIPVGGQATFVFSHDRNAGVLVMNNVPPPAEGTVYQMWLVNSEGSATSAGTMTADSVSPSTTAVVPDLGDSAALAFTVEPGTGSPQPTGAVFAQLPLV